MRSLFRTATSSTPFPLADQIPASRPSHAFRRWRLRRPACALLPGTYGTNLKTVWDGASMLHLGTSTRAPGLLPPLNHPSLPAPNANEAEACVRYPIWASAIREKDKNLFPSD